MLNAAGVGFGVSISLIMAIGAQNAFVLRQGLRGRHVAAVVLTCALSDAILISAGVFGGAFLREKLPQLAPVMTWIGALFLLIYGLISLRSAWRGGQSLQIEEGARQTWTQAVGICLALTWLNPHVYLDTVLLIGAIAADFPGREAGFATGAILGSFVFFLSLGYGAAFLRPLFSKPSSWRVLDAATGLLMWFIAYHLIAG